MISLCASNSVTADFTIHDRLRTVADAKPDAPAFTHLADGEERVISFGHLARRSAQHCSFYQARGARRGDIVLIILRHDERLLYGYFGAMLGGMIPCILAFPTAKLDPDKYRSSLAALCARIQPRLLITTDDLAKAIASAGVVGASTQVECAPALAELETMEEARGAKVEQSDVALLQHSSGTTGLQKGVALTHAQILNQVGHYSDALGLLESDAIVSWLPLYHDMGLIACTMLPVLRGLSTIWMSPLEWVARPTMLLETIARERPTLCWQPNFAFSLLARRVSASEAREFDLSSVRSWINCSEPVSATTMREFAARFRVSGVMESSLGACYAMAENVFAVTQSELGRPLHVDLVDGRMLQAGRAERWREAAGDGAGPRRALVSCGGVIDGSALRVVDRDGRSVPERVVGELAISGDSLFGGYSQQETSFDEESGVRWFRTGDLGYVADRHCYVTGRVKDLIIIAGRNIHPHDVEAIAGSTQGVIKGRVAAVGGYDSGLGTERLIVIAESRCPSGELARIEAAIRQAILGELDCVVDQVILIEPGRLLKTSSGKVARSANAARFVNNVVAA